MKRILCVALIFAWQTCYAGLFGGSLTGVINSSKGKKVVVSQAADTTAPTITSVNSDKANGTYGVGEIIDIDVTFSEIVSSTGSVTVELETGTTDRTCTFTVSNATTGSCNYTVQSGDSSSDLTVKTISGTILDAAGNAMTNFVPATNLAANKAIVIDTTEAGSNPNINESLIASRTSGVAPLAVFFDASGTTSTSTTRPMHQCEFSWSVDDTAATWGAGIGTNNSKNSGKGMTWAHVFRTAGTYTVTKVTKCPTDGNETQQVTITVTDPNTVFASNTLCVSTSGTFGACPTIPGTYADSAACVSGGGCTTSSDFDATINNNIATKKRILYRRTETFAMDAVPIIDEAGPGYIGAYDTGAKPIITRSSALRMIQGSKGSTPTGVSDWRFVGLKLEGNSHIAPAFVGEGSFSRFLFLDVDAQNVQFGIQMSQAVLNVYNNSQGAFTHALWDEVYLVDSTVTRLVGTAGGNGVFLSARRFVAMGNTLDNQAGGEHGIRTQYCDRCVIEWNTVQGIAVNKAVMTVRGGPFAGDATIPSGQYTEKVMVSYNWLKGNTGVGILGTGPQNPGSHERGRNQIFECNYLDGSAGVSNPFMIWQSDITVRNNFYRGGGSLVVVKYEDTTGGLPKPNNIDIYNNTYANTSGSVNVFSIASDPGAGSLTGMTYRGVNNLMYIPSGSGGGASDPGNTGATKVLATNSSLVGTVATNPNFSVFPPTQAAHFTPANGSYADGTGSDVSIFSDCFGNTTEASPDIGAVIH